MEITRIVEIAAIGNQLPVELIIATYKASRHGIIVLALNGVSPQIVNAVLDPIVVMMPLTVPGVRYIDIQQISQLRDAVASISEAHVATQQFFDLLVSLSPFTKIIPLNGSCLKGLVSAPSRKAGLQRWGAHRRFECLSTMDGRTKNDHRMPAPSSGAFHGVDKGAGQGGETGSWT